MEPNKVISCSMGSEVPRGSKALTIDFYLHVGIDLDDIVSVEICASTAYFKVVKVKAESMSTIVVTAIQVGRFGMIHETKGAGIMRVVGLHVSQIVSDEKKESLRREACLL